ncbi:hypothetical protein A2U01_0062362, partial [Trifolium medium]|nr:hypothetical protein [Trifolium medium]
MQLTGTEDGSSRPRGKGATASVRRVKDQELAAQRGHKKRRRVARTQPQPEP